MVGLHSFHDDGCPHFSTNGQLVLLKSPSQCIKASKGLLGQRKHSQAPQVRLFGVKIRDCKRGGTFSIKAYLIEFFVLGSEPLALGMLGQHSPHGCPFYPLFTFGFERGSH